MRNDLSITFRNSRKRFVKCADCGSQTLPQNASKVRPWTAAASLYIAECVNDGALCFDCANARRRSLCLPLEKEVTQTNCLSSTCERTLKKVRINSREFTWEISTLESLLTRWLEESFPKSLSRDTRNLLVAVNNTVIPASDFGSTPLFDGDEIIIAAGASAGG